MTAGLAAILLAIDFNDYRQTIAAAVERQTGLALDIRGDIKIKPAFVPTIVVHDVHSRNVGWAKRTDLLTVHHVDLTPQVLPLFSGALVLQRLVLAGVEVNLETDRDGRANWNSVGPFRPSLGTASSGPMSLPAIRHLAVDGLTVHFNFGWSQVERTYRVDSIAARAQTFGQPIRISVLSAIDPLDISIEGTLGSAAVFSRNESFPVNLKGRIGSTQVAVTGAIEAPQTATAFDLRVALEGESAGELGALAGYAMQEDKPLKITARATGDRGGYNLDDIVVRVGGVLIRTQDRDGFAARSE